MDDLAALGECARRRLWHLLTRECEAMAQHAFSMGHIIPIEVVELLDHAFSSLDTQAALRLPASAALDRDELKAGASPPDVPALVALSRAHTALAVIIAPATPEAVLAISDERIRHPRMTTFGPVPVARQMLGLALVSLIVLLGVSLSADINNANMSKTLLDLSGVQLLVVEIFLLSASSLGSCFANLQRVNRFVSDGTYDPKYQSTYWTRWVMGVISGIVLSQLVYDVFVEPRSAPTGGGTMPGVIGQPLLALLGGYSVDVVHSILNRIINAVSSVFRSTREQLVWEPTKLGRCQSINTGSAEHGYLDRRGSAGQRPPGHEWPIAVPAATGRTGPLLEGVGEIGGALTVQPVGVVEERGQA